MLVFMKDKKANTKLFLKIRYANCDITLFFIHTVCCTPHIYVDEKAVIC